MDQYRCPTGVQGRKVAASMNLHHSDLTDWGLSKVKIGPDFTILDVGCGGGRTITKLAKLAPQGKVYGIDCSKDMVEYSVEVNRDLITQDRVSVVEGFVDKTGFPDNYFDLVTAVETYYFWSNLQNAFKEIYRILKPNGYLLIINEMIKDGTYEIENKEMIEKTHVNLMSISEIKEVLATVGYKNVQIFKLSGSPWNIILAQNAY
ncbi:MAG: class I SAM-dependent methyltransferase [Bacteroidales bacterium]|nr:class I SAM-dependent methyltransferase [Bacteroidales bacterium]